MGLSARVAKTRASVTLALFVGIAGCGSTSPPVGVSQGPVSERPLNLTFVTPEGGYIDLADLRGQPVLLYLFATFDVQSQAALRPVSRFTRLTPEVQVIGVAIQPRARALLDAWRQALSPPFPVAYEPDNLVARGLSPLGRIGGVPAFIAIDERGYAKNSRVGFVSVEQISRLFTDAP